MFTYTILGGMEKHILINYLEGDDKIGKRFNYKK